jgi:2-polyprenyl-3-methyl-5-hydroxy-6-metoxy-1,4-benzoquinol methylase
MEYINELKNNKLLKSSGQVLDLVCHNGKFAQVFADMGYTVDAVDIKNFIMNKIDHVSFFLSNIETYQPENQYDIIFARNVLFFTKDPIGTISRYLEFLKPEGVLCLSFLGSKDPWSIDHSAVPVELEDIEMFIKENNLKKIFFNEVDGEGLLMNGDTKYWHMYKMVLQKL